MLTVENVVGVAPRGYVVFVNNLMDDMRTSINAVEAYKQSLLWHLDGARWRGVMYVGSEIRLMAREEGAMFARYDVLYSLLGGWFLSDKTPAERLEDAIRAAANRIAGMSETEPFAEGDVERAIRAESYRAQNATFGKLVNAMMSVRSSVENSHAERPVTEGMLDRYEALAACVNGKASLLKRPGAERQ